MLNNLEKTVEELRLTVPFKKTTVPGDVALMVRETEAGLVEYMFARIISCAPEIRHRKEWWHVDMVFLTIPLKYATFIVNGEQLNGEEIFTIHGLGVFIKAVDTDKPIEVNIAAPDNPTFQVQPRKIGLTLVKPISEKKPSFNAGEGEDYDSIEDDDD
jgi:hypothetical protein